MDNVNNTSCCDFDDFLKAMADMTRQRILTFLQAGEMNENNIVARMNLTQPTISHPMSLLRHANLLSSRGEGKYVFYRANSSCMTECRGEILSGYNVHHREARDKPKG